MEWTAQHEVDMISHSSAGVQQWGHPLSAVNNGPGHVDVSHTSGSADFQLSHSRNRQPAIVDLTMSGWDTQEREPPVKRVKLDAPATPVAGKDNPRLADSKPFSVAWRGRPAWSFHALISETYGTEHQKESPASRTQEEGETETPPPLPVAPWSCPSAEPWEQDRTVMRDASPVRDVPTIAYRIEVPDAAPVLKGDSELFFRAVL